MVSSSNSFHTRSISLPSSPRISSNLDEILRRLSSSEAAASTSSSSSLITNNLGILRDLYDSVEVFLQLPRNQQALIQENNRSSVDGLLNASLCFLNVCGTSKDVLSQTKQQAQDLQSVLRRKRDVAKEVEKYLASRKMSKKALTKCSRDMKNNCSVSSSDDDNTLSTLGRVEQVTITLFESLLSFIVSGPRAQSKWSSFMNKYSRVNCDDEEASEFQTVDCLLHTIVKKNTLVVKEDTQNELRKLELSIQDLEDELDALMRCMIRSRVFLLNILTQ